MALKTITVTEKLLSLLIGWWGLRRDFTPSITSLVKAIDAKDNYTMNHCKRVTFYALELAQYLGCSNDMLDALRFAGPIHDVGKIGVRDEILLKPGGLESEERDIMQNHVTIGGEIVKPLHPGHLELAVVRNHHERFDGEGYPDGLKGNKIPLVVRIFSVIDTYDAMSTDRPYRDALSPEESVAELIRCRGSQFDGDVVNAFIEHTLSAYKEVAPIYEGHTGSEQGQITHLCS
ncbi:MAG: HD-GYP domain-containing protein [Thermodesulfobacteriota bacterium]